MKFADKYELSDAVTSGRLETFLGRDVGSGERVLVHIFDAPVKQPGQPTVMWVLESFRALAPEAPGLVIAAGRYDGTNFAYLVTRVPDEVALRQWKQNYESSTAETREIPVMPTVAPPPPRASASPRPNAEVVAPAPLSKPQNPPTGFFGLRPPVEASARPADPVVKRTEKTQETSGTENGLEGINFGPRQDSKGQEPGEFTKQFFVGTSEPRPGTAGPVASGPVAPLPVESVRAESAPTEVRNDQIAADSTRNSGSSTSPHGGSPEFGGFTSLFSPGPKSESAEIKNAPSRSDAPRTADDAKSGDFTKFFQGPFDGERPSEIPNVSPNVTSTPRGKVPGEFTQMFGAVKDNPFVAPSPSVPVDELPLRTEPGSFTRSFADPVSPSSETKGNGNQKPAASAEPNWTQPLSPPLIVPANPPEPAVPQMNTDKPRESRPSVQGGATQLFSVPGGHSVPAAAPPASGPSEYTRIISGGVLGLNSSIEKPAAEEGPAAGGLPTFKMPAAAVPPPPKIAAPPAPKLPKMPPAPKIPSVGALVPKPKSSYLPMIIILNVSLIIAVLLIVYFAIKH